MSLEIQEYDPIRDDLNKLRERCNFIPDASTKDGYEASRRVYLDDRSMLKKLEDKRTDLKKESLERGRLIDSAAKAIKSEIETCLLPHKEAYQKADKEKKELETKRIEGLRLRLQAIIDLPEMHTTSHSSDIEKALLLISNEECLDFYELSSDALKARNKARAKLGDMYEKSLLKEHEAAELDRLRVESEERAKKDREDKIRKEASEKAEREKREAIDREEKAKQAAIDAEESRKLAEKKAAEDKIEADRRLEEQRVAAEQQRKIDAEEADRRASQAAIDARNKAIEDQRIKEEDELEELKKREANKAYIGKIRKEIKEDLISKAGISEAEAKKIVLAISNGDIRNTKINY